MPTPCFWYAADAQAAFTVYLEAFPGAEITSDNGFMCELSFGESRIVGMNGGLGYRPNKTLSIYAELASAADVQHAFAKLTAGGKADVLMPLDKYDWSERYAWLVDAWGVNWQLTYAPEQGRAMSAALMYTGAVAGRAAEAMALYAEVFVGVEMLASAPYPEGADAGRVMHAQLGFAGGRLVLMDSGAEHGAAFTEGGSLMVLCDTQAEIDRYWKGLMSGGGSAGRCGWCKDRFGVSWQIVPRALGDWLSNPTSAKRTGEALQQMSKLVIADLEPKGGKDVWAALRK